MTSPFTGDRITLTGIEVFAHHGAREHERNYGQRFVVDVTISANLQPAAATDALDLTINYSDVASQVEAIMKSEPVDLIETLAERICAAVLEHPLANAVEVTIHKPKAPLSVTFHDVSVTLVRHRP